MASERFLRRAERILRERARAERVRRAPRMRLMRALGAGLAGALVCLVTLKALAIARGDLLVAVGDPGVWLLGADPLSGSLAQVLSSTLPPL